MLQPVPAAETTPAMSARPSRLASVIVAAAAALAGVLVVGAAGLWLHYGTAVFFEMVRSGIAACM